MISTIKPPSMNNWASTNKHAHVYTHTHTHTHMHTHMHARTHARTHTVTRLTKWASSCSVLFFSLRLRFSLVVLANRLALSFHFDTHTHTHTHTHQLTSWGWPLFPTGTLVVRFAIEDDEAGSDAGKSHHTQHDRKCCAVIYGSEDNTAECRNNILIFQ